MSSPHNVITEILYETAPRVYAVARYPPCQLSCIGGAIIATPFHLEVSMLGRRSHARLSLESGAEGVLSLARDISVRTSGDGHLVAISRDAAAIGERVRVLLADDEATVVAEVIESKPVICDGAVRHRLLMRCSGRDVVSSNRAGERHE